LTKEKLFSMKAIAEKELAREEGGENLSLSPKEALEMILICLFALEARDKVVEQYRKGVLGLSNPDTIASRKEDILK